MYVTDVIQIYPAACTRPAGAAEMRLSESATMSLGLLILLASFPTVGGAFILALIIYVVGSSTGSIRWEKDNEDNDVLVICEKKEEAQPMAHAHSPPARHGHRHRQEVYDDVEAQHDRQKAVEMLAAAKLEKQRSDDLVQEAMRMKANTAAGEIPRHWCAKFAANDFALFPVKGETLEALRPLFDVNDPQNLGIGRDVPSGEWTWRGELKPSSSLQLGALRTHGCGSSVRVPCRSILGSSRTSQTRFALRTQFALMQ